MAPEQDPLDFDDILDLEDQFYQEGYQEGLKDGTAAGKIEGRAFGMAKGYEKFFESGWLHSRATVWSNRCTLATSVEPSTGTRREGGQEARPREDITSPSDATSENLRQETTGSVTSSAPISLPPLPTTRPSVGDPASQKWAADQRKRRKAINMILELLEPSTLSFKNETADVDDFDSRMKGAQARLKVIESGIDPRETGTDSATAGQGEDNRTQSQQSTPKPTKPEW